VYLALKQGIAAWYFRKSTPEAVEAAIRWDSGDPEYFDSLATLTHLYADTENSAEIVSLCETATRLSPHNAQYWAHLGAAYEWAGRKEDARRAFERSRQLFPNSPDINWQLANSYVRARMTTSALRALRKVLEGQGVAHADVFALAASATRDNEAILDEMLPPRSDIFFEFLDYQVMAKNMDAAGRVWTRLLQLDQPFDFHQALFYMDTLIQFREIDRLIDAWSALVQRFPGQIGSHIATTNLIVNGSFEFEILNGGLDWRIAPVEGAAVTTDSRNSPDGAHSLRIDFDGLHNLDYGGVFEYVPVKPSTQYRFSGLMRVSEITTDSGPRFQIYDAYDMGKLLLSSQNLVGTSRWTSQELEFKTDADTRLLVVRIVRPLSRKFDNRIAGTVWVDRVSLIQEGAM
jgi:hypothetical protein